MTHTDFRNEFIILLSEMYTIHLSSTTPPPPILRKKKNMENCNKELDHVVGNMF